jgi:hypothetical protein
MQQNTELVANKSSPEGNQLTTRRECLVSKHSHLGNTKVL